jgi:glycosyltransferase involved in cell wall biosynthesis
LYDIIFIRSNKAILPEIDAYIQYFNKTKHFRAFDSAQFGTNFEPNEFDIVWEFKGFGGIKKKNDRLLVHEYASLSTGALPLFKNFMKAKFNYKPNLRVFLNEDVKNGFSFHDEIDFCYRDMGIDQRFLVAQSSYKEYEFTYVGSVSKSRELDNLLGVMNEKKLGKLCLIGDVDPDIYAKYKNNKDFIFTGKVPYSQVPEIASKAVYGINYIPDKYPFNIQTSTKLLEYLALGLKVLTTDYRWVRRFEQTHECSFYKLKSLLDFDMKSISTFQFVSNVKMEKFLWDKIIKDSKIEEKLMSLLK